MQHKQLMISTLSQAYRKIFPRVRLPQDIYLSCEIPERLRRTESLLQFTLTAFKLNSRTHASQNTSYTEPGGGNTSFFLAYRFLGAVGPCFQGSFAQTEVQADTENKHRPAQRCRFNLLWSRETTTALYYPTEQARSFT